MFYDSTPDGLKDALDKIAVPLFAIDWFGGQDFRIVAINEAHTEISGVRHADALGTTPHDVLDSAVEADAVIANYEKSVTTGLPTSYREILTFQGVPVTFDTTLSPLSLEGQSRQRLIGTALRVVDDPQRSADIQWFLAQSEAAILALAEVLQHSVGGVGHRREDQAAMAMMVRNVRNALDQLRCFSDGETHIEGLLNKSEIPPEVKIWID